MPPMKKQASPAPTPRAAALSQSASQYSAGATSAWQNIAGNSPRLAAASHRAPNAAREAAPLTPPAAPGASRVAMEPQRVAGLAAPATEQETVRQVGWREVDRAVGMSTKRKHTLFGIGFGLKVPVFETEKVKLPVYQETDRNKRYYAAVKKEVSATIKRTGFEATSGGNGTSLAVVPQSIEQFNSRGGIYFFGTELSARSYSKTAIDGDYAIVEFVMPEYQEFTPDVASNPGTTKWDKTHAMRTTQGIPAACIKNVKIC